MIALAITESAAQGTDLYLQVRFFDKGLWPGSGDQFLFADYLAGALDERGQDVESTTPEPHRPAALEQEPLRCMQLEWSK
jgi:hypothetical protein